MRKSTRWGHQSGGHRLVSWVSLVAGLLILGGGGSVEAESDPTKKPFTFPDPVQQELGPQEVRAVDGEVQLMVELIIPSGWKLNVQSPIVYYVDVTGERGPVDRGQIRRQQKVLVKKGGFPIPISVGRHDEEAPRIDALEVTVNYFVCQEEGKEGEGLCRAGSVIWTFPLHLTAHSKTHQVPLTVKVPAS